MSPVCFPEVSVTADQGYWKKNAPYPCSQEELLEALRRDSNKEIKLVWTPATPQLVPPEQVPCLQEMVLVRQRLFLKKQLSWALGYTVFWIGLGLLTATSTRGLSQIFLFNLMAFGLIPVLENGWAFWQLRRQRPSELIHSVSEVRYWAWIARVRSPWTLGMLACIGSVGLVQLLSGLRHSVEAAGIVKPAVWHGEVWRLLTGTLLHGSTVHFMFNGLALWSLGKLVEVLTHPSYTTTVFVLAALTGSLFSMVGLPTVTSVGASGGILGLLGFLLAFGYRRRRLLPAAFLRGMLKSVFYIASMGLIAREMIDNAAHLGGLVAGVTLGLLLLPRRGRTTPLRVSRPMRYLGVGAGIIIALVALVAIGAMLFGS